MKYLIIEVLKKIYFKVSDDAIYVPELGVSFYSTDLEGDMFFVMFVGNDEYETEIDKTQFFYCYHDDLTHEDWTVEEIVDGWIYPQYEEWEKEGTLKHEVINA